VVRVCRESEIVCQYPAVPIAIIITGDSARIIRRKDTVRPTATDKRGTKPEKIPKPERIVWQMRAHRQGIHMCTSLTPVFDGCEECERLEEQYSISMEWHSGKLA